MKSKKVSGATARMNKPVRKEVLVEKTRIATRPTVEIRKPATLAQALTDPEAVVVKPGTKYSTRIRRISR